MGNFIDWVSALLMFSLAWLHQSEMQGMTAFLDMPRASASGLAYTSLTLDDVQCQDTKTALCALNIQHNSYHPQTDTCSIYCSIRGWPQARAKRVSGVHRVQHLLSGQVP